MNHAADDPDDLVRNKIDLNHITNISKFKSIQKSPRVFKSL
jgi:hypothetical protein